MGLALLAQAVINLAVYELWFRIVRKLGGHMDRRSAWKAFFLPYLARYIPGKVALITGKVHYCNEMNVPTRVAVISIMVENGLIITAGLLLASVSSFYLFAGKVPPAVSAILLASAGVLLFSFHPAVLTPLLNVPMRLLKRDPIRTEELLGARALLLFFAGYAALWPLGGLVYGFAAAALGAGLVSRVLTVCAAFVTAGALGQASMVAPAGLGVREGILFVLLEGDIGPALAVAAVALARLITVAADAAFALATPLVLRVPKPKR